MQTSAHRGLTPSSSLVGKAPQWQRFGRGLGSHGLPPASPQDAPTWATCCTRADGDRHGGGFLATKTQVPGWVRHSGRCPHCLDHDQDDYHLMWGCTDLALSRDPAIQDSQWLADQAFLGADIKPCLRLRGLTPRGWTFEPKLPVGWVASPTVASHIPRCRSTSMEWESNIPATRAYASVVLRGSNILAH